jgi:M6 family metalloprotease-like protein
LGCQGGQTTGNQDEIFLNPGTMPAREDPFLGLQSQQAIGEQRVLVLAVRFPDVEPSFSLEKIRGKVVQGLNKYVKEQSYGMTWVKADFRGWIQLPDPIRKYKVSPLNFEVDSTRVKKLIEDSMTAVEKEVDFSQYQHMILIPGTFTTPGKGYGMICYCANPGMLSGVRKNVRYVPLESEGGQPFGGGVYVAAENAHVGMFAHDFFHGLGGIHKKKRLAPCLYDYERQSDSSRLPDFKHHAIFMGPWDIMSHHFIERSKPPQGISSFTKIRLGWISPDQVLRVNPGSSQSAFLSPLSKKGKTLVVKIPLKQGRRGGWSHFYLVENRQPIGYDRILPDTGLLILEVNVDAMEGSGTVKVMDADPGSPYFSHATFKLGANNRNAFIDKKSNVAIIPLWSEKGNQGVLVTTPEKISDALQAALLIGKVIQRYPEPRGEREEKIIEECVAVFNRADFKTSYRIAQQALQ